MDFVASVEFCNWLMVSNQPMELIFFDSQLNLIRPTELQVSVSYLTLWIILLHKKNKK
jgi:hypothetical protein